jgi:uncharacterized membrane protein
MQILDGPYAAIFIVGVLFFIIAFAEWLGDKPFFKHLSTGLLVIILGAIAANTGFIPATNPPSPVYDAVFSYLAPLSIFLILLGVNLKQIKLAGKPMLVMFLIGAACTVVATVFVMWLLNGRSFLGEYYHAIAGMLSGTYIGGSLNFNAVALHYDIAKEGDLFAATTVADNVISAVWVAVTLLLPNLLTKVWPVTNQSTIAKSDSEVDKSISDEETIHIKDATLIIFLSISAYLVSVYLSKLLPFIPMILWLTSFALICAHIPFIHKLKGHKTFGLISMYLFLTVVGTHCDIATLLKDGALALNLMLLVSLIVLIHGVLIYSIGYLLKQDKDIISIASQANVGGTATAMALAKSLKRNELVLPAILIGALGNALGTYVGIFIAEMMFRVG